MTNKYLKEILEEMFKRVKIKYNENFVKNKDWYLKYTWTENEENEFKEWLFNYMKTNKEARNSLMVITSINKKFINSFVNEFCFNYGWRLKDVS